MQAKFKGLNLTMLDTLLSNVSTTLIDELKEKAKRLKDEKKKGKKTCQK